MAKFNQPDPRNAETLVWVNGLVPRAEAKVAPIISLICVILTIDMQITDYPALNKFFGGDDLFIFSLMSLLASLIAWPIIGFSLRPPYQEGGRASAKLGLVGGGLIFLYGLILMSYVGAS